MARIQNRFAHLEQDTAAYFAECDEKNSGQKNIVKPYTLSGLLCRLNITRGEFDKLICHKRYAPVLLQAKRRIEAFIEENSLTGGLSVNASSNSLKYNFGWGDKREDIPEEIGSIVVSLGDQAEKYAK